MHIDEQSNVQGADTIIEAGDNSIEGTVSEVSSLSAKTQSYNSLSSYCSSNKSDIDDFPSTASMNQSPAYVGSTGSVESLSTKFSNDSVESLSTKLSNDSEGSSTVSSIEEDPFEQENLPNTAFGGDYIVGNSFKSNEDNDASSGNVIVSVLTGGFDEEHSDTVATPVEESEKDSAVVVPFKEPEKDSAVVVPFASEIVTPSVMSLPIATHDDHIEDRETGSSGLMETCSDRSNMEDTLVNAYQRCNTGSTIATKPNTSSFCSIATAATADMSNCTSVYTVPEEYDACEDINNYAVLVVCIHSLPNHISQLTNIFVKHNEDIKDSVGWRVCTQHFLWHLKVLKLNIDTVIRKISVDEALSNVLKKEVVIINNLHDVQFQLNDFVKVHKLGPIPLALNTFLYGIEKKLIEKKFIELKTHKKYKEFEICKTRADPPVSYCI